MLHVFLQKHRSELIDRCKAKALLRARRTPLDPGFLHGIPRFLDQLVETLRIEQRPGTGGMERLSGVSGAATVGRSDVDEVAALHGRELLLQGFTVDEVVHDYGDLCQAVTELAAERGAEISVADFHTLNRCLDNAIADAVKEYSYGRKVLAENHVVAERERHGTFVHELRNMLNTATLAFSLVKAGKVTAVGATGGVLDRSLAAMATLIERSVIEVRGRGQSDVAPDAKPISLARFVDGAYHAAVLEAEARGCRVFVSAIDASLAIKAEPALIAGALANLLSNAFKYSYHGTEVEISAYAAADRVLIAVSDSCGGIPEDVEAKMFMPFVQGTADRSGLGLGLAISRKYVEAIHGTLTCRNIPGKGCVFTIDLPRYLLPEPVAGSPVDG